ncbi:hypothetical protein LX36DRAFT_181175 [Colletotrichum falcatum]|nr:hypothetical protein LX36DRAFT_181175 [Colletotrichum falcatum]
MICTGFFRQRTFTSQGLARGASTEKDYRNKGPDHGRDRALPTGAPLPAVENEDQLQPCRRWRAKRWRASLTSAPIRGGRQARVPSKRPAVRSVGDTIDCDGMTGEGNKVRGGRNKWIGNKQERRVGHEWESEPFWVSPFSRQILDPGSKMFVEEERQTPQTTGKRRKERKKKGKGVGDTRRHEATRGYCCTGLGYPKKCLSQESSARGRERKDEREGRGKNENPSTSGRGSWSGYLPLHVKRRASLLTRLCQRTTNGFRLEAAEILPRHSTDCMLLDCISSSHAAQATATYISKANPRHRSENERRSAIKPCITLQSDLQVLALQWHKGRLHAEVVEVAKACMSRGDDT